ncbi:MAG: translation elongation factor Ts [Candidatus Omnitrophica bacterium CG11_big_fil_rev_8_21_14_0_20_45_26]|uniref:Elongation factor Ts n=1 Tax=Candidatus Abzuiibacterium crystallinum TaxID=1974748 RepID=A0A2H0LP99_9BACT|nr:MAG: translation elongation factor Ts [Candidatus Omnitrophica bacterium CG11_big_fil_rev_8_21_14_0_20_45_26]PIW63188.1 MAG: translation elongation factor Ts [Candidatus Omnitrophica bacterium CG12_big_fil_rev_8_21_14_0_65_45_16]
MADVASASKVKELREMTGAGIMDCKQALSDAKGDLEAAKDLLRKKGLASAQKRANREVKDGQVFVESNGQMGILAEVACETDFVAKTEDFQKLGQFIIAQIKTSSENIITSDAIKTQVQAVIGKIGENIAVRRAVKFETKSGFVASYRHHNHKIGILVELAFQKPELAKQEEVIKTARDIAMQTAALRPQFLKPEEVSPEFLEREKNIFRDQVKDKPAAAQDKIIEGKLRKRFEEICLLNQKSVIDNSKSVETVVAELGKKLGDQITVKRFCRFEIGVE